MNKSIFLLLILCLTGCKKASDKVYITGEIKGLGTDTIYMYGMDEGYDRVDSIFVKEDKFSYRFDIDTITSAFLLIKKEVEYPIFFDKGNHITIKGEADNLTTLSIDGNTYNQELTQFQKELQSLSPDSATTPEKKAEEFIRQHTSSYVSLYLLDKYFAQKDEPDFNKIKELMKPMIGILQDKSYVSELTERIELAERAKVGKYAPYFTLPNLKGEKISRTSEKFKDKNILAYFWASWGDSAANRRNNDEMKALYRTYRKNDYLALLGISLDMDKTEWESAVERDTLEWEQVRCAEGMASEVAKQYGIQQLPLNVLISPEGRIIAKDLHGDELKKQLEEAIDKAEKRSKERKKK